MKSRRIGVSVLVIAAVTTGGYFWLTREHAQLPLEATSGIDPRLVQPHAQLLPTFNIADAVGWKDGETPVAAASLRVNAFAAGLNHPRWLLPLPNGDVLVAETAAPPRDPDKIKVGGVKGFVMKSMLRIAGAEVPSPNRIILLRDADGDGVAEVRTVLVAGLNSPFGMALAGGNLYVANTDSVVRFPFQPGQTHITAPAERLVTLPAGGHWTRSLLASADGRKLYVTVGSGSNIADMGMQVEQGRAAVWEINPQTRGHRIFANGLRNPNGLAWRPGTNELWIVANERDMIGSDLVPDYLTSVRPGGFYGWPWSYYGGHVDVRVAPQRPDMVARAIKPDYALGAHVAAVGLTFSAGARLPFGEGVYVGEHGSWNRKPASGYKVVFVRFRDGRPTGQPIDVLTGFRVGDKARGRPVGVTVAKDGALLVADDVGNSIWRVTAAR